MKALAGFCLVLSFSVGGWAQNRGGIVNPQPFVQNRGVIANTQPFVVGSFGNAVFPGGTSALPGVTRFFGNAAFPSGFGFPRLVIPGAVTDPTFLARRGAVVGGRGNFGRFGGRGNNSGLGNNGGLVPYPVPVYVGGFYDNPYLTDGAPPPPQPQQPNVVVVYPSVQQPVMLPPPDGYASAGPGDLTPQPASTELVPPETQHYLIAFTDHTIYSAVAFWVEGDTLHYFTSGNTHNQVSLSMVDKALTERLNRESGIDMRLP
jgi:hypothetical protein